MIQIAMGWTDSHLHQFVLQDKSLKCGVDEIARLVEENRYDELLAASRGMRVFVPTRTPFGDEMDMDGEDEDTITLAEVCPKVKSKLTYEYDFGDGWEHTVEVQKMIDPQPGVTYPVCLAGKRACPPEDCGGIWGYERLLDVIADPEDEDHDEMMDWLGDDFDPEAFDLDEVNATLAEWRKDR